MWGLNHAELCAVLTGVEGDLAVAGAKPGQGKTAMLRAVAAAVGPIGLSVEGKGAEALTGLQAQPEGAA